MQVASSEVVVVVLSCRDRNYENRNTQIAEGRRMWPDIDPVAGLCHRSTSAGIHNTARSSWVQFQAGAGPYCVGTACAPVVLFSLTVQQGKK